VCLFRLARQLAVQLVKGKVSVPARVTVAFAVCVRSIITGPQIAWTAPNGKEWGHADVIGPRKWWLMIPRATSRNNIGLTLQTLTSEEQEALRVVGGADHGLAAVGAEGGPMDAKLDGEEEDMPMHEDDILDNAETDMQLDG